MARLSNYGVQKLLGHSSVLVTQVYSHLAPSELHATVDKISSDYGPTGLSRWGLTQLGVFSNL